MRNTIEIGGLIAVLAVLGGSLPYLKGYIHPPHPMVIKDLPTDPPRTVEYEWCRRVNGSKVCKIKE